MKVVLLKLVYYFTAKLCQFSSDLEENKMQLIGDALYDNVKDYKPCNIIYVYLCLYSTTVLLMTSILDNLIEDEDMLTIAEKTLPWQHECTPLSPSSKYSFASKFDFGMVPQ